MLLIHTTFCEVKFSSLQTIICKSAMFPKKGKKEKNSAFYPVPDITTSTLKAVIPLAVDETVSVSVAVVT